MPGSQRLLHISHVCSIFSYARARWSDGADLTDPTQDLSQHYGVYGREESITGNCHIRIAFAANKPETADLLSRMAGDMTVHMEQRSFRGDRFDLVLNQQYVAQQQVQRRLLTPDEAMRLPDDDALIFVAGQAPIRASKIRYYEDELLASRAEIPPAEVSAAPQWRSDDWGSETCIDSAGDGEAQPSPAVQGADAANAAEEPDVPSRSIPG